jgi:hypothetical protein
MVTLEAPAMEAAKLAGRTVGILILLQMLASGLVNGVLEAPLFGVPGFLVNAAPHAQQIGLAAVLGVLGDAVWIVIAVTVFSLVFARAPKLALSLVALSSVVLALAVAEAAGVMSMVSLSNAYAKAEPPDRAQLEAVRVAVASARNWAHFLSKAMNGVIAFIFYLIAYRSALIPRGLAILGLLAIPLMISSVLRPLFGYEVLFPIMAPMALTHLVLSVWLVTKGFPAPPHPQAPPAARD